MRFRFIGQYTGKRDSITYGDVTFHGNEPAVVSDKEMIRRLSQNVEFEKVKPLDDAMDTVKEIFEGEDDELKAARAEYQEKVGKKPYHGWDITTLREKMNEPG